MNPPDPFPRPSAPRGARFAGLLLAVVAASALVRGQGPFPIVMQTDMPVKNAQFAGLLLAEQKGWYREAGLDVRIESAQAGIDEARRVAGSDNVVGSIESGLFLSARSDGLPVVAVGTMFQASPLCLISFSKAGIRAPRDLAGRHIVVHADGHEALATVLAKAGVPASSVRIDEEDYGNDALLSGRYDAQQGYTVDEFVALRTEGRDVVSLPLSDYGHVAYSQVYFVSESFMARHRSELLKFIAVSGRGWRAAMADVPGTARMIVARYEPGLSLPYQEESLQEIGKLLWAESPIAGAMRPETWSENAGAFLRTHPGAKLGPMASWADFTVARESSN